MLFYNYFNFKYLILLKNKLINLKFLWMAEQAFKSEVNKANRPHLHLWQQTRQKNTTLTEQWISSSEIFSEAHLSDTFKKEREVQLIIHLFYLFQFFFYQTQCFFNMFGSNCEMAFTEHKLILKSYLNTGMFHRRISKQAEEKKLNLSTTADVQPNGCYSTLPDVLLSSLLLINRK